VATKKSLQIFTIFSFISSAIVLVIHSRYFNIIVDDAYISFRYASNLAAGNGLVYNHGEHVEGYTNFLWVLILGLADRLGFDIPTAAQFLGIGVSIACLAVVYCLSRTFQVQKKWSSFLAIWFLVLNGSFAFWVTGGLEVPLFTFLLLSASYIYVLSQKKQDRRILITSSVLWGMVYLARPEGALLFLLNILYHIVQINRNQKIHSWCDLFDFIFPGSLIIALHLGWRMDYYGYPFPNTFYAKVGSDFIDQINRGLIYTGDFFKAYGIIFIPVPILYLLRRSTLKFPLDYLLLLSAGYTTYVVGIGGDSLQSFRFLVPVLPVLYLIAQDSWNQIFVSPPGFIHRQWPVRLTRILSFIIIGLCLATTLSISKRGVYLLEYASIGGTWVPTASNEDINLGWKQAGLWLKSNTPIDYKIAVQPAGYIPFYSQRFTLDMLGLSDTHIAHLPIKTGGGKAGHEKWDGNYILSRQPEIIILGMGVYPAPIQDLTDRDKIKQIIQPRRVDWEIWGNPEFIAWYKPASVLLPNGKYLDYFIKRDVPVEIFLIDNVGCSDVVEIPLTGIYRIENWKPFSTNGASGLVRVDNGIITLTYSDNPQIKDLYTFELINDPALNNVIALKIRVNIANGTYFSVGARPPNQKWKEFLSYYRGWGKWETVSFPVEAEPLRAIAVSISEPDILKNAGLTYQVSIESIDALVCQDK
jgi:arabinofuranosyltransferase